jgi:hypothetical protein
MSATARIKVHCRAGHGYQDVIHARISQVVGIHRHRFRPANHEPADAWGEKNHQQRQHDRANRVNMHDRIERAAALQPRRVVPAFFRRPRMAEFVKRQQHDQPQIADQTLDNPICVHVR